VRRKRSMGLKCLLAGPDTGFFGIGTSEVLVILLCAWLLLGPKGTYEAARNLGSFIANLREAANQAREQFISALGEDYDSARREVEGIRDSFVGALSGEVDDFDGEAGKNLAAATDDKSTGKERVGQSPSSPLDIATFTSLTGGKGRSEDEARSYFLDALRRVNDPNQVPPTFASEPASAAKEIELNGHSIRAEPEVRGLERLTTESGALDLRKLELRVAALEDEILELKMIIRERRQ
jgi:Sec-independent protein translocase protein TatA